MTITSEPTPVILNGARFGTLTQEAGFQVVNAGVLAREHHPRIECGLPLMVVQIDDQPMAAAVQHTLLNAYPAEHPVTLMPAEHAETWQTIPLNALMTQPEIDGGAMLYAPPLDKGSFTDLQEIVAYLRAPEGCPWDRVQTLSSLRQDLLSETAEVLEAIDAEQDGSDNSAHIAEELGDVLLLATMMTQIATDEGRFQMADVIHHIVTKLIRRHPHVFAAVEVDGVEQVFANWDEIKAQEKADKGQAVAHPLAGIPHDLPALEKASALQKKAGKAGLLDREALAAANPTLVALLGDDPDEASVGELLWQLTALAKQHDINAENALRSHVVNFRRGHGG